MNLQPRVYPVLSLLFLVIVLPGCGARYQYKHTEADGSSCELSIWSARDVQAGDIKVSKSCALTGGAESLTANAEAMKAVSTLIGKLP